MKGLQSKQKQGATLSSKWSKLSFFNKAYHDTIETLNKKCQNMLVTVLEFTCYFREIGFGHRMINEIKEVGGITFIYEPIKCLNTNSEKNATTMVYGQIPPSGI